MIYVRNLESTISRKVPIHGDTLRRKVTCLVDPRNVGPRERVRPQNEAVHDLAARDGEEPNCAVWDCEPVLGGQSIVRSLKPAENQQMSNIVKILVDFTNRTNICCPISILRDRFSNIIATPPAIPPATTENHALVRFFVHT